MHAATLNKHSCDSVNKFTCLPLYNLAFNLAAMQTFGERLKYARLQAGFTSATALAERVKQVFPDAQVTQQGLHQIESGETKASAYIVQIAHVIGFNPAWLVSGEGPERAIEYVNLDKVIQHVIFAMEAMSPDDRVKIGAMVDAFAKAQPAASNIPATSSDTAAEIKTFEKSRAEKSPRTKSYKGRR